MKICTYNVNSIRAREELMLKWLEKRDKDIDVLCLQEIKVTEDRFPRGAFAGLGYHCEVFGQAGFNGVAICSKEKPEQVLPGFGDETWDRQKRIVCCRLAGLTVVNVYAPHGDLRGKEKYLYKQEWYSNFLKYLEQNFSPSDPLLVVGDLNITRDDLDVFDPVLLRDTIGTMPEERHWLTSVLEWGLVDCFRFLNPGEQAFTWWDYTTGAIWQNRGMRIDYILCTRPLLKNLAAVEVDLWPRRRRVPTPSDHAPVIATFGVTV